MKNLFSQIKLLLKDLNKQDKILLFLGLIACLCLFSSCEVQAAASSDYISLESSYNTVKRDITFYNNILNNYYGRTDIDISKFSGITSSQLSQLQNGTYSLAMIPCPDNKVWVRIAMQSSGLKMYYYDQKYTLSGNWIIGLDIENKAVISIDQYANNMTLASVEDKPNLTTSEFESTDYQKYLLYDYFLYYHGEIKSSSQSGSVRLNYYQERNKLNYWDWTDDNLNNNYLSGDIELFDDYFEVRDFETNISDYSMYLLKYGVIFDQYGGYRISSGYESKEISKPDQGSLSTWQITNLFNISSGESIYAIGIGTPERTDLIRSEWFDSDENLTFFMNSNSFRLRYYVEDLPNFFLQKDVSGNYPSGDTGGIVVNPDGGDTDLTGGITGIWQALINLPKMILDGLVGLFVPDADYFYNEDPQNLGLWQRFSVFMQSKLGFLWDVLIFIPNLISTIIDVISSFSENWSVTIPDLKVPGMTGVEEIVFLNSFEWSPYDWINQKVEFRNLYDLYLDIIDFFVYWGLIWFFVDTVMTVFGNSDSVIDTTNNE